MSTNMPTIKLKITNTIFIQSSSFKDAITNKVETKTEMNFAITASLSYQRSEKS